VKVTYFEFYHHLLIWHEDRRSTPVTISVHLNQLNAKLFHKFVQFSSLWMVVTSKRKRSITC